MVEYTTIGTKEKLARSQVLVSGPIQQEEQNLRHCSFNLICALIFFLSTNKTCLKTFGQELHINKKQY